MPNVAATVTTVDQIIDRLDQIIAEAVSANDRIGYFAAMYNRVTQKVRDSIAAKDFDDNARMERFDVLFANRYLDALAAYRAGELPSSSWLVAFEAARRTDLPPLAHLYLGMATHINLDLGVTAARIAPGAAIAGLRNDFLRINDLLASLIDIEKQENAAIAPAIRTLAMAAGPWADPLVTGAMNTARASAWSFALELANLSIADQVGHMAVRDTETALANRALVASAPSLRLLEWGESGSVADQIKILAAGELNL